MTIYAAVPFCEQSRTLHQTSCNHSPVGKNNKIIESDEQWTLEIILPVYRVYFRMKRYVFHLDARQGLRFEICVISVSPYTVLFPYPKFLRKDLSRTLPWPHGYLRETLQGSIYYAEINN